MKIKKIILLICAFLLSSTIFGNIVNSNIGCHKIIFGNYDNKPSPFPDGVVPVEYIETTSADQYIDTEYIPTSWKEVISMTYMRTHSGGYAFGGFGSIRWGINFFLYSGNGCAVSYGNAMYNVWDGTLGGVNQHLNVTIGDCKAISFNIERGIKIEVDLPEYDFSSNNNSVWILKSNGAGFDTPLSLRLYDCIIIDANGEPARDMVPVRVGEIGCMFDKVTQQLFYNKGSGNFNLGRDL